MSSWSDTSVTRHAINRYRARCPDSHWLTNLQIVAIIRRMVRDIEVLKVCARGEVLISGEWILIRAESTIVTVYKGTERELLKKKVNGRSDDNDEFSTGDRRDSRKRRRKTGPK